MKRMLFLKKITILSALGLLGGFASVAQAQHTDDSFHKELSIVQHDGVSPIFVLYEKPKREISAQQVSDDAAVEYLSETKEITDATSLELMELAERFGTIIKQPQDIYLKYKTRYELDDGAKKQIEDLLPEMLGKHANIGVEAAKKAQDEAVMEVWRKAAIYHLLKLSFEANTPELREHIAATLLDAVDQMHHPQAFILAKAVFQRLFLDVPCKDFFSCSQRIVSLSLTGAAAQALILEHKEHFIAEVNNIAQDDAFLKSVLRFELIAMVASRRLRHQSNVNSSLQAGKQMPRMSHEEIALLRSEMQEVIGPNSFLNKVLAVLKPRYKRKMDTLKAAFEKDMAERAKAFKAAQEKMAPEMKGRVTPQPLAEKAEGPFGVKAGPVAKKKEVIEPQKNPQEAVDESVDAYLETDCRVTLRNPLSDSQLFECELRRHIYSQYAKLRSVMETYKTPPVDALGVITPTKDFSIDSMDNFAQQQMISSAKIIEHTNAEIEKKLSEKEALEAENKPLPQDFDKSLEALETRLHNNEVVSNALAQAEQVKAALFDVLHKMHGNYLYLFRLEFGAEKFIGLVKMILRDEENKARLFSQNVSPPMAVFYALANFSSYELTLPHRKAWLTLLADCVTQINSRVSQHEDRYKQFMTQFIETMKGMKNSGAGEVMMQEQGQNPEVAQGPGGAPMGAVPEMQTPQAFNQDATIPGTQLKLKSLFESIPALDESTLLPEVMIEVANQAAKKFESIEAFIKQFIELAGLPVFEGADSRLVSRIAEENEAWLAKNFTNFHSLYYQAFRFSYAQGRWFQAWSDQSDLKPDSPKESIAKAKDAVDLATSELKQTALEAACFSFWAPHNLTATMDSFENLDTPEKRLELLSTKNLKTKTEKQRYYTNNMLFPYKSVDLSKICSPDWRILGREISLWLLEEKRKADGHPDHGDTYVGNLEEWGLTVIEEYGPIGLMLGVSGGVNKLKGWMPKAAESTFHFRRRTLASFVNNMIFFAPRKSALRRSLRHLAVQGVTELKDAAGAALAATAFTGLLNTAEFSVSVAQHYTHDVPYLGPLIKRLPHGPGYQKKSDDFILSVWLNYGKDIIMGTTLFYTAPKAEYLCKWIGFGRWRVRRNVMDDFVKSKGMYKFVYTNAKDGTFVKEMHRKGFTKQEYFWVNIAPVFANAQVFAGGTYADRAMTNLFSKEEDQEKVWRGIDDYRNEYGKALPYALAFKYFEMRSADRDFKHEFEPTFKQLNKVDVVYKSHEKLGLSQMPKEPLTPAQEHNLRRTVDRSKFNDAEIEVALKDLSNPDLFAKYQQRGGAPLEVKPPKPFPEEIRMKRDRLSVKTAPDGKPEPMSLYKVLELPAPKKGQFDRNLSSKDVSEAFKKTEARSFVDEKIINEALTTLSDPVKRRAYLEAEWARQDSLRSNRSIWGRVNQTPRRTTLD